mmetsp:Transcript_57960/g.186141  ORF Transcript_57960/g.186141 Transcript_57960/m.186141 type:complete len:234 (+) Transcript_57960:171-872(+)
MVVSATLCLAGCAVAGWRAAGAGRRRRALLHMATTSFTPMCSAQLHLCSQWSTPEGQRRSPWALPRASASPRALRHLRQRHGSAARSARKLRTSRPRRSPQSRAPSRSTRTRQPSSCQHRPLMQRTTAASSSTRMQRPSSCGRPLMQKTAAARGSNSMRTRHPSRWQWPRPLGRLAAPPCPTQSLPPAARRPPPAVQSLAQLRRRQRSPRRRPAAPSWRSRSAPPGLPPAFRA